MRLRLAIISVAAAAFAAPTATLAAPDAQTAGRFDQRTRLFVKYVAECAKNARQLRVNVNTNIRLFGEYLSTERLNGQLGVASRICDRSYEKTLRVNDADFRTAARTAFRAFGRFDQAEVNLDSWLGDTALAEALGTFRANSVTGEKLARRAIALINGLRRKRGLPRLPAF